jgi:hypothetical protein
MHVHESNKKESAAVSNAVFQQKNDHKASHALVDNRSKAVVQTKLKALLENNTPDQSIQLKSDVAAEADTIQLVKITTHAGGKTGGGEDSPISTAAEVEALLSEDKLSTLKTARSVFIASIAKRKTEQTKFKTGTKKYKSHQARITQEEGWLGEINTRIHQKEEEAARLHREMLRPKAPKTDTPEMTAEQKAKFFPKGGWGSKK